MSNNFGFNISAGRFSQCKKNGIDDVFYDWIDVCIFGRNK
jgi:hypothetical protein